MKLFFFHLMPYANLDLDFDKKYSSTFVVLPNTNYDPETGSELYNRYLDELELAGEIGWDGVCVNEHHQNAYGLMPSPMVMASTLARRTKDIKICIVGSAFCLREHPLTLAEEYAMLDNITRGRIVCGMVRGIGAEYFSFGSNPTLSHERYHEAHDLVIEAWTREGPFSFEGKHYHFEYVNLWPRPYQQPHPPIWVPSLGSEETIRWAAHPDRKYPFLQAYSPAASVEKYLNLYRQIAEKEYGYTASGEQLGWTAPIYVSETDESAERESRDHFENFFNKFLRLPVPMLTPPGYTSIESTKALRQHKTTLFEKQTFESLSEYGTIVTGSPETVLRKLTERHDKMGFQKLLTFMQFGTLPRDLTEKSMRLFAQEVMPGLKPLGETASQELTAAE